MPGKARIADIDAELAAAAIVLFVDHARRQPAHARYSAGRSIEGYDRAALAA